ncbi:MAG: hypothetical protein WAK63_16300 [Xanthobacteraceae bacterium]
MLSGNYVERSLTASRLLIHLRGVGSYPIHSLIFAGKTINPAFVALVIPDDHMPAGTHLVRKGLHDRLFFRIRHARSMRPSPAGFQRRRATSAFDEAERNRLSRARATNAFLNSSSAGRAPFFAVALFGFVFLPHSALVILKMLERTSIRLQ